MSKSALIMSLYDGKRTTRQIADIVGCAPEYVRVVARQRKGGSYSETDRRYLASKRGQAARKRQNDLYKPARLAWQRALYATADKDRRSLVWRKTYKAALDKGKSRREARSAAELAAWRVVRQTGNREVARKAWREART